MNNSNIPSNYKGKYLSFISNVHGVNIHIDAGTVLVQDVVESITYFELAVDYTFFNSEKLLHFRSNDFVPMEVGSAVDNRGNPLDDSKQYALPEYVRFPSEKELEWYGTLSLV